MWTLTLPAPVPAAHARLGTTWSGKRVGYHDTGSPYAVWRRSAESLVIRQWAPHRGAIVAHAPVQAVVLCVSERPPERTKSGRAATRPDWMPAAAWKGGDRWFRPVRPDAENFAEAVFDAMQAPTKVRDTPAALAYPLVDDGQIVDFRVVDIVAARGEAPRTVVAFRVLTDIGQLLVEDGARLAHVRSMA